METKAGGGIEGGGRSYLAEVEGAVAEAEMACSAVVQQQSNFINVFFKVIYKTIFIMKIKFKFDIPLTTKF